ASSRGRSFRVGQQSSGRRLENHALEAANRRLKPSLRSLTGAAGGRGVPAPSHWGVERDLGLPSAAAPLRKLAPHEGKRRFSWPCSPNRSSASSRPPPSR